MEQIAAFMLLVGCSGNATSCTEIPVPVPAYRSVAECQSDLPLQIRLTDAAERQVLGACKAVDPSVFEQSATIDWAVSRQGQLLITFNTDPQMVASR